MLLSPFSAPFGGFHYRNEYIFISEIEDFLEDLKEYAKTAELKSVYLSLPPLIYLKSFNAKVVNSLIRLGYKMLIPEITSCLNLIEFNYRFSYTTCRNNYKRAVRNKLTFKILNNIEEKRKGYELIWENRSQRGRLIHMTFDEIIQTNSIWPTDFFCIYNEECQMVACAIFYQFPENIAYAALWGDNLIGRSLLSMDFLIFNLWNHYKLLGYQYVDIGNSTVCGMPNETLLRFKEIHECNSSIRFRFSYEVVNE